MNQKLKKGERVWLSQKGHNGFIYPNEDSETLLCDVVAEQLAWAGGGEKFAVSIPENAIRSTGSFDKKIPVWIKC